MTPKEVTLLQKNQALLKDNKKKRRVWEQKNLKKVKVDGLGHKS